MIPWYPHVGHKEHGDRHAYILTPTNWPPVINLDDDDPYTLNLDRVGGNYTMFKGVYPGFKGIDENLIGDGIREGDPDYDDSDSGGHGSSGAHLSLNLAEIIGTGRANKDSTATFTVPPSAVDTTGTAWVQLYDHSSGRVSNVMRVMPRRER